MLPERHGTVADPVVVGGIVRFHEHPPPRVRARSDAGEPVAGAEPPRVPPSDAPQHEIPSVHPHEDPRGLDPQPERDLPVLLDQHDQGRDGKTERDEAHRDVRVQAEDPAREGGERRHREVGEPVEDEVGEPPDLHRDEVQERRGRAEVREERNEHAPDRGDDRHPENRVDDPPVPQCGESPSDGKEQDVRVGKSSSERAGRNVLGGGRSPDHKGEQVGEDHVGEEVQVLRPSDATRGGIITFARRGEVQLRIDRSPELGVVRWARLLPAVWSGN